MRTVHGAYPAGALILAACAGDPVPSKVYVLTDESLARPCEAQLGPPAATTGTEVVRSARLFCDIASLPVAVLSGSVNGEVPEPGSEVLVTRAGQFVTTAAHENAVILWDAAGSFVRKVARPGSGPGEFSPRGGLRLFLGPADSVFVLDGENRWSVFDDSLDFHRSFRGMFSGRSRGSVHLLGDGSVLTTARLPGTAEWFHIQRLDGSKGMSFGRLSSEQLELGTRHHERLSTLDRQGGMWVAPPSGSPFLLEHWTIEGAKQSTLKRRAEWLPEQGDQITASAGGILVPDYDLLHLDSSGLLWIAAVVQSSSERRPTARDHSGESIADLYDVRIEVIDPRTHLVLASYIHDGPHAQLPPFSRFIPSTNLGYRSSQDSLGMRSLEVFRVTLVHRQHE